MLLFNTSHNLLIDDSGGYSVLLLRATSCMIDYCLFTTTPDNTSTLMSSSTNIVIEMPSATIMPKKHGSCSTCEAYIMIHMQLRTHSMPQCTLVEASRFEVQFGPCIPCPKHNPTSYSQPKPFYKEKKQNTGGTKKLRGTAPMWFKASATTDRHEERWW